MLVVLRVKDIPSGSPAGIIFLSYQRPTAILPAVFQLSSKKSPPTIADLLPPIHPNGYIHVMKYLFTVMLYLFTVTPGIQAQSSKPLSAKGKLFIIGGGSRPPDLMQLMIETAALSKTDYIIVLPMSSAEPDSSFFYLKKDLARTCNNAIINMNFTSADVNNPLMLDSLKKARLIFITGGDQNRFMKVVLHTPVHKAIEAAYKGGSTIAGTSAGAAVMSRQMITGKEYSGDSLLTGTFKKIALNYVDLQEGLGLIDNAIIDQHFIARSRYNRLLSVLATHPSLACIGIDEGTAIVVAGKTARVAGLSQVIKLSYTGHPPVAAKPIVNMRNIRLDILTRGDHFTLP